MLPIALVDRVETAVTANTQPPPADATRCRRLKWGHKRTSPAVPAGLRRRASPPVPLVSKLEWPHWNKRKAINL
jgi:hypothetical protein